MQTPKASGGARRRSIAWRCAVAWLLFFVGLQSVLLAGQRTTGAAHFHAAADGAHRADHDHDSHGAVAHHSHAAARDDVVYVDEDAAEPPMTQANAAKRLALDVDAFLPSRACVVAASLAHARAAAEEPSRRSRVVAPLEKPPRRSA